MRKQIVDYSKRVRHCRWMNVFRNLYLLKRCSFHFADCCSLTVGRNFWIKGEFKRWKSSRAQYYGSPRMPYVEMHHDSWVTIESNRDAGEDSQPLLNTRVGFWSGVLDGARQNTRYHQQRLWSFIFNIIKTIISRWTDNENTWICTVNYQTEGGKKSSKSSHDSHIDWLDGLKQLIIDSWLIHLTDQLID